MKKIVISVSIILVFVVGAIFLGMQKGNFQKSGLVEISSSYKELIQYNEFLDFHKKLVVYLDNVQEVNIENFKTLHFDDRMDCNFGPHTPIDVLSNGDYVICSAFPEPLIVLYSSAGDLLRKIGRKGQGPGEFMSPKSISISHDNIFCYDIGNMKVLRFNSRGDYISEKKFFSAVYTDDFEVTPANNIPLTYNVYSNNKLHLFTAYNSYDQNDMRLKPVLNAGSMELISIVSRDFITPCLAVNEDSLVICGEPQKFGFHVLNTNGKKLLSSFKDNLMFLNLLKNINQQQIDSFGEDRTWRDLFSNHS